MYEESKLKEARYFYSRMLSETDNRDNLLFDLSAFLSAARSVLQYAIKEAKTKAGGQQWYQIQVTSSNVLTFFKDKRDINVHATPIQVSQHTSIELTEILHVSESIHIKKFDQNGQLIGEYSSEPSEPTPTTEIPPKVTHRLTFQDWPGNEDVLRLCDLYLNELERVVADGQSKGFLTR